LPEIRSRDATAGKSAEPSVELLAAQSQAATLRARLNVLEAKAIPYTGKNSRCSNKPEIPTGHRHPGKQASPACRTARRN